MSSRQVLRPSDSSRTRRTSPLSSSLSILTVTVGLVTHAISASLERVHPSVSAIVSKKRESLNDMLESIGRTRGSFRDLSSIIEPTDRNLASFLPPSSFIPASCPS